MLAVNNCTQDTCHTLQSMCMCIYVHTLYTAYIQYWLCLHTLVSGSENLLRRLEFRQHVLQSTSACLRAAHLQAARPTPPTNSLATNIGLRDTSLKCVVATAASLQRQAGRRGERCSGRRTSGDRWFHISTYVADSSRPLLLLQQSCR